MMKDDISIIPVVQRLGETFKL